MSSRTDMAHGTSPPAPDRSPAAGAGASRSARPGRQPAARPGRPAPAPADEAEGAVELGEMIDAPGTARLTGGRPSSNSRRRRPVPSETVVASGLGLRERSARPLQRQGCCASLRDGLRPPLTPEPLPDLGTELRAGQEAAPAWPRSPSPRRCSYGCSNGTGTSQLASARSPGRAPVPNYAGRRYAVGRGLKIGRSAV